MLQQILHKDINPKSNKKNNSSWGFSVLIYYLIIEPHKVRVSSEDKPILFCFSHMNLENL